MSPPNIFDEVLLVEDNPGDVRLLKEMLKESELDPTLHVVSDGPEAVEFLRQTGQYEDAPRPSLVLLDIHLARMDGEEVLEKVDGDVEDVPIIAISGSQEGAVLKLDDLEDRVDACLEKPVVPDELEETAADL